MKFKVGEKYNVQFWDHCLGHFKLLCEVSGLVISEDKTHVFIAWWHVHTDCEATEEVNREMVSVVKATIVKKRKIPKL